MKLVYKCDYCGHTKEKRVGIAEHEKVCKFNPALKRCYSCRHRSIGIDCVKDLPVIDAIDGGGCKGWEAAE